jgi:hypothetical protein
MARKVSPKKPPAAPAGADDLAVLNPDVSFTVAGRKVTVREYGFIEGLQLRPLMAPFVADLGRILGGEGECLVEDVLDALGQHIDLVRHAMARSISAADATEEQIAEADKWLASLGDAAGDVVIKTWWGVCGFFFVRQVVSRSGERARHKAFAGATSTPTSSPAATAPPPSSGATPPAS